MDRSLKIGFVSPYDYSVHGGVNDHIRRLASQFKAWGNAVRVIGPCSAPQEVEDEDFIPMGRAVPVPSGGSIARVSFSIWLRPRIRTLLRQERFDVIHLHEPMAGFVTLNVLGVASAVDSVLIGTFHTDRGTRLYKIGGGRLAMRYFQRLHGRIAVSQAAYSFINEHLPAEYEIIPNGIHVDDFANATPFPHLRDGMINLLFLGRLEKRKGLKYLLGAFGKLKWKWPKLRLIVVGPGKPDAESYRIVGERGLRDVEFVGVVSDEDKARYYKSADIYCSPATGRESFGIVLLEAMASGTPVVASDIEGYSNVVTHGREGLLAEPKSEDALADAIDTLLRDPATSHRLSAAGRKKVEHYRWERVAGQVMDYYKTVLDSSQRARVQ